MFLKSVLAVRRDMVQQRGLLMSFIGFGSAFTTLGIEMNVVDHTVKGIPVSADSQTGLTAAGFINLPIQTIFTYVSTKNIVRKWRAGTKINKWDLLQLFASSFFFLVQLGSLKSGAQTVRDVQNQAFEDYRNSGITARQDKRFRYMKNKDFKRADDEERMGGEVTMKKIYNFVTTGKYGL